MPGQRRSKPLLLTEGERRTLEQWARPTSAQRLARRSRMVLACAKGLTNRAVARRLHVSSNSVAKWRERFRTRRLEALADEPRCGAPRKVTHDQVVDIITRTLEAPPAASQWTTRTMAKAVGLSKATIWRIWQTFDLQSPRRATFKLSADPQFAEKVRDIVGVIVLVAITGGSGWLLMSRSSAEESTDSVEATPLEPSPIVAATAGTTPSFRRHAGTPLGSSASRAKPPKSSAPPTFVAPVVGVTPHVSLSPISGTHSDQWAASRPSVARADLGPASDPSTSEPEGDLSSPAPQLKTHAESDARSLGETSGDIRRGDGHGSTDRSLMPIDVAAPAAAKNPPTPAASVDAHVSRSRNKPLPYGPEDAGVTPPIPVRPRLLAGLKASSPGVRLDALRIAVVVNEDGTAYPVTAVSRPQNMGEFVLLTAALGAVKSWAFNPAMKDGVAVKYRLIVPVRAVSASDR